MKNLRRIFDSLFDNGKIADIGYLDINEIAVRFDEPTEIALDAGTREVVEQTYSVSRGEKAMREVMLTYANALLAQGAQLAACHRYHTPQARLARLLLMIDDRMQTTELRITQDLLAHLLGTRRATVTQAANQLQDAHLIEYVRGKIKLLDRKGLEQVSCSCYAIITAQQDEIDALSETS